MPSAKPSAPGQKALLRGHGDGKCFLFLFLPFLFLFFSPPLLFLILFFPPLPKLRLRWMCFVLAAWPAFGVGQRVFLPVLCKIYVRKTNLVYSGGARRRSVQIRHGWFVGWVFFFGPVSPRLNKSFSSLRMDGVVIFSVKHENWGQMSPLLWSDKRQWSIYSLLRFAMLKQACPSAAERRRALGDHMVFEFSSQFPDNLMD